MGKIIAVCISEKKGTAKVNVKSAELVLDHGIENDAHAGKWHRQVSLLSYDRVKEFNLRGAAVNHGDFAENILVDGIDFKSLPVGTRLLCNDVILEITQIGKECHHHCEIYKRMGDCIMPREGVFAKVLSGGLISEGDEMTIIPATGFRAGVITASDKGSVGERVDLSGPAVAFMLEKAGYHVVSQKIVADEFNDICAELREMAKDCDLVLTTGGTGLSPRDVTPEATIAVCDRMVPGIGEYMRLKSMEITPRAMLSRGVSGVCDKTLIINLPGSPKAAKECLGFVLPSSSLLHGLEILLQRASECGSNQ